MGFRIWISEFEVLGLGHRISISNFGSQDFDLWVCVSGIGFLGLGLRICLCVWVTGFGSLGLGLRI